MRFKNILKSISILLIILATLAAVSCKGKPSSTNSFDAREIKAGDTVAGMTADLIEVVEKH